MALRMIMELIKALLLGLLSLIPELPSVDWAGSLDSIRNVLSSVNMFISLPVLGNCLLAVLVCYNARMIWSVIMWVVRKIPGVS